MPRSIWSGNVSFGLVNIPVKLAVATKNKDIRFNQLHERDHSRIRYRKVCAKEDEEVPSEEIVKGYEVARDQYVVLSDEEMDELEPESSRVIELQDFVKLGEVDPAFFDKPYFLVPDKGAGRSYALLWKALRDADRVGIAKMTMRNKEYLVAIRPKSDVLTLETMRFAEELVPVAEAAEDLELAREELKDRELEMAKRLVDALATEFEPEKYHNEYRERVLELVEKKAEGEEVVLRPREPKKEAPKDLMEALEKSIAEAQERIEAEG